MFGNSKKSRESHISAFSTGVFFIIIGAIFLITPGFFDGILAFFADFEIVKVPNWGIYFFAPGNPSQHTAIYFVAGRFSLVWGIFLITLLCFRLFAYSPLNKKAENFSDIIFWLGNSTLIHSHLNEKTTTAIWFAYWSLVMTLIGVSLIVRALILVAFRSHWK
jgi:hypothetical protein